MDSTRKPFQGVANIVRFNWPFYVLASLAVINLLIAGSLYHGRFAAYLTIAAWLISLPVFISLLVSLYVYDLAGLYTLKWLDDAALHTPKNIVNISAGFDETSALLQQKYGSTTLTALDFYDAVKHTEPSIKRARRAYPSYPGTQVISTTRIPFADATTDAAFLLFAAHEIRNGAERIGFFKELERTLAPGGKIIVAEHLRDVSNFLAYNIGFLHFLPRAAWLKTFEQSGLYIEAEKHHTPFVTVFILRKNDGAAP